MKKELKDYLHLYGIDAPVSTIDGIGTVLTIHPKGVTVSLNKISLGQTLHGFESGNGGLHRTYLFKDSFFKLILRPLSDMSFNEAVELIKIETSVYGFIGIRKIDKYEVMFDGGYSTSNRVWLKHLSFTKISPEQVRFILSKYLDPFDLIGSGLAINKTTLK